MTDHERSISGLPANEYRVENYIANGVSGRDFEVLDADIAASAVSLNIDAWDARDRELLDRLVLEDLDAALEKEQVPAEFAHALGAPALRFEAQVA